MQRVTFRTTSPFLLRDVSSAPSTGPELDIAADLYLPKTARPVAAVVLSQGLSGVSRSRERRYAALLAARGHAALVFDSFAARLKPGTFDPLKALRVTETMLLADAHAALGFLAERPDIRSDEIAIAGFSYGGMISVLSAYRQIADLFSPSGPRFSRHVAYYGCSIPRLDDPSTTGAPVTMLIGAKDRNIDLARTRLIADDLRAGGSPVDLTVYPDLYHQWDDADAGEEFIFLRLAHSKVRIRRDNDMVCERTGLGVTGPLTRSLVMALGTSPTGYHIRPDAAATARSDADFLAALEGEAQGSAILGAEPVVFPAAGAERHLAEARSLSLAGVPIEGVRYGSATSGP